MSGGTVLRILGVVSYIAGAILLSPTWKILIGVLLLGLAGLAWAPIAQD